MLSSPETIKYPKLKLQSNFENTVINQIRDAKYSGAQKCGLVWILNGQKEVNLIWNGILNSEAQLFEIQTKMSAF